ncbi:NAD(P)H-dependent glycerol-3-phosphate dehydrogenase [Candidatus Halocynthiibacter alkanivorans]|uniref:NAD(P)H-dependent glycerol-3-phosphate dehydrogenase n=1 Tax=Candidatus Halocynthiibacter alkanivorans TaxID=2267619 RepID=UPI000DF2410D|nr:NAD(P)H-dependent glycerol-3-phosphate dehydrogenase [Candidatus Halocynthiibacter alkanivorans]
MSVAVLGAGAFGTALAISIARDNRPVQLWARDAEHAAELARDRVNSKRLAGAPFPDSLSVISDLRDIEADTVLLAVPMQALAGFLAQNASLFQHKILIACCKGVDLKSNLSATDLIRKHVPDAGAAILSGPSFAADIARGLPTALTLATKDEADATRLQAQLSTSNLRLYRSTDIAGVETGGALKNVIAIACGLTVGAGLGESARAALMTRGYAEMVRFGASRGARADTLAGLSGFGDLVLTCTSEKSRNFSHGLALGRGDSTASGITTEGVATARAVARLAADNNIDMPITRVVAAILDHTITVAEAMETLLSRPLTKE